jgi:hypothetical protein
LFGASLFDHLCPFAARLLFVRLLLQHLLQQLGVAHHQLVDVTGAGVVPFASLVGMFASKVFFEGTLRFDRRAITKRTVVVNAAVRLLVADELILFLERFVALIARIDIRFEFLVVLEMGRGRQIGRIYQIVRGENAVWVVAAVGVLYEEFWIKKILVSRRFKIAAFQSKKKKHLLAQI